MMPWAAYIVTAAVWMVLVSAYMAWTLGNWTAGGLAIARTSFFLYLVLPLAGGVTAWIMCAVLMASGIVQSANLQGPIGGTLLPDRDNTRNIGSPSRRLDTLYAYRGVFGNQGVQVYDRKVDHAGPGGFLQEEVWNNLPGFVTGSSDFEEMTLAFYKDDSALNKTWFALRTAHGGAGVQRGIAVFSVGGFTPTETFDVNGSFNVGIQHDGSAKATIAADGSAKFAGPITVQSCTGCGNGAGGTSPTTVYTPEPNTGYSGSSNLPGNGDVVDAVNFQWAGRIPVGWKLTVEFDGLVDGSRGAFIGVSDSVAGGVDRWSGSVSSGWSSAHAKRVIAGDGASHTVRARAAGNGGGWMLSPTGTRAVGNGPIWSVRLEPAN